MARGGEMESYTIKEHTQEEVAEILAAHPKAQPKPFSVFSGSIRMGFYDTREEAEKDMAGMVRDETIGERYEAWADEIAAELGCTPSHVNSIVKDEV
jgi:hypothetical protein